MKVSDVLRAKGNQEVFTISPDATVRELLDQLNSRDIGALVVIDEQDQIVGMISERDLVRKLERVENPLQAPVRVLMTTDTVVCEPDDSFSTLMSLMTDRKVRHVPVVEEGRLTGLLSIGDAVKYRMDQLKFERDQLTNYVTG